MEGFYRSDLYDGLWNPCESCRGTAGKGYRWEAGDGGTGRIAAHDFANRTLSRCDLKSWMPEDLCSSSLYGGNFDKWLIGLGQIETDQFLIIPQIEFAAG